MLLAMPVKKLRKGESGQAMVEFAVVFPVVFLLCLVIMQTFLLLSARQMVNYAAYCAARSAIVFLPDSGNAEAKKKAERAAIIALWSISPMKGFGSTETFIKPIEDMVEGATGINFNLARRYNMARSLVTVKLTPEKITSPHEDVTAEVTYNVVMGIPLANRIFYEMWKGCEKKNGLYTFPFTAKCTLPAAGKVKTKKCCS